MKFGVITGNPTITRKGNGKYLVVYADPSDNWKITKYDDLTFEEVSKLPFVNEVALSLVK